MVNTVLIWKVNLNPGELPEAAAARCTFSNGHAREAVSSPMAAAAAEDERLSIDRNSATRRWPKAVSSAPPPAFPGRSL